MRLQQLFEDIQSDYDLLMSAEKAWDMFLDEIKGHVELVGLDEFEAFEKSFSEILSSLSKYRYRVGTKDDYIPINIEPSPSRNVLGRLVTTSVDHGDGNPVLSYRIDIYFDPNEELDMVSINDFYRTFEERFEHVFIHEYTHYLDARRSKDKVGYLRRKRKDRQEGRYIDTASEYNAFYVQMLKEIKNSFNRGIVVKLFQENPTFENFESIVRIETHSGQMLSSLGEKYKRSFKKRLFQLYKSYYHKFINQTTDTDSTSA